MSRHMSWRMVGERNLFRMVGRWLKRRTCVITCYIVITCYNHVSNLGWLYKLGYRALVGPNLGRSGLRHPGVVPLKESADKKKIEGKGGIFFLWNSMGNLVDNSQFFLGHLEKMVDESDELPKRLGFSVGIRTCAG